MCDGNLKLIDDRVWFKLHKRFFGFEKDLYLGVSYIPPLDSCRLLQTQEMWSAFEKEITYLQLSGNVMVMGDLNARTGD